MTPDSFSDGGNFLRFEDALRHAEALLESGADVIDIGGQSTRPPGRHYGEGATEVSAAEELERVLAVLGAIRKKFGATVSIDSTRVSVVRAALDAGASVVNDVSCAADTELLNEVASYNVHYVLMHQKKQGTTSCETQEVDDYLGDLCTELHAATERCLAAGIDREKIWWDPGLGFGKTSRQSMRIMAGLEHIAQEGYPLLVGHSRKSFIADSAPEANGALPAVVRRESGTSVLTALAYWKGAAAVRTHDVHATFQALGVAKELEALSHPASCEEVC